MRGGIAGSRVPSWADRREAVRIVRGSSSRREALDTVRPRGVSGIFRSRLPLASQLRLAAQQDRLLWWSPGFFAILAPPAGEPARGGSRWLRLLDRWWDLLMFFVPPVLLLTGTAVSAIVWIRWAGASSVWWWMTIACAFAAMAYVSILMIIEALRGFHDLYRTIILGRPKEAAATGIGQVLASRWSMPLCQAPSVDDVPELLDAVRSRMAAATWEEVLCPEAAVTSVPVRAALQRQPGVGVFTADPPVLIIHRARPARLTLPPVPANITSNPLHGIPLLLGVMTLIILVGADGVVDWEREDCARLPAAGRAAACAERPVTYGDALYWLLNRLSGGDPEGLGAHSFQARSIGLFVTLMSVVIVGWVITTLIQQAGARSRRFGHDVVDAYNDTLPSDQVAPPSGGEKGSPGSGEDASPGRVKGAHGGGVGPGLRERSELTTASAEPTGPGALLGLAVGFALGALLARRRR